MWTTRAERAEAETLNSWTWVQLNENWFIKIDFSLLLIILYPLRWSILRSSQWVGLLLLLSVEKRSHHSSPLGEFHRQSAEERTLFWKASKSVLEWSEWRLCNRLCSFLFFSLFLFKKRSGGETFPPWRAATKESQRAIVVFFFLMNNEWSTTSGNTGTWQIKFPHWKVASIVCFWRHFHLECRTRSGTISHEF